MTTSKSPVDGLRPLPARPNLEFEKKRARRMVLESTLGVSVAQETAKNVETDEETTLHAETGHETAIRAEAGMETAIYAEARRREEPRAGLPNAGMKLSDAHLLIAREYGFASWRRLSTYYKTWQLHELSGPNRWNFSSKNVNDEVARLLKGNGTGVHDVVEYTSDAPAEFTAFSQSQLAAIAAFVPRFYGATNAEIRNSTLSEAEAQLVVARLRKFPSWEAMQARLKEDAWRNKHPKYQGAPTGTDKALEAIRNRDGDMLVRVLETFPDCFYGPSLNDSLRIGPVWEIIKQFMQVGDTATRNLLDRLAVAGVEVQQHLNSELLAGPFFRIPTEQIKTFLELGADPNWVPPNGASVLEYAIMRYMNGEAVDLIAARVKPRKAFWIAAGLGDVATMRTFLNKRGQVTDAARRDRPDALMLGVAPVMTRAQRPNASDTEILSEAFYVAGINGRFEAMQDLLDLGVSVDYAPGRFTPLYLAIAHEMVEVVEFLVQRGADRDFMLEHRADSVRELSLRMMEDKERHPNAARIHALLSR
ncbi:MAG: hypothetical protein ABJB74_20045 [Gemmatimonas sp.]